MIRALVIAGVVVRFVLGLASLYVCLSLAFLAVAPSTVALAVGVGVFGLTNLAAAARESTA